MKNEADMSANNRYKDSVFSFLFSDPDTLRELYGALEGVTLDPSIPITINTLEGVLFKARLNDISFEIGDKLVILIEHQSTINPNMPLRLLMYIARIYEKITGGKNIYSEKKLPLLRPEFIVLYNGTAPYPDEAALKLSDSFERADFPGIAGDRPPELELIVKVYNINQGHNEEKLRKSRTLEGYSAFIAKAREYEAAGRDREEAMKEAVNWCTAHNILRQFFETNATEVVNMLMTEWNWDDAFAVQRMEGREEGREEGRAAGLEKGREEGVMEAAKNALAEGLPVEVIQKITGLGIETIKKLTAE
jgi:predicted transposase/invertase (TIGR01784 family)